MQYWGDPSFLLGQPDSGKGGDMILFILIIIIIMPLNYALTSKKLFHRNYRLAIMVNFATAIEKTNEYFLI